MRPQEDRDTRLALRELVERRGPDAGARVVRVTRAAAKGADRLVEKLRSGAAGRRPSHLTGQDQNGDTLLVAVFDLDAFDDDSVFG